VPKFKTWLIIRVKLFSYHLPFSHNIHPSHTTTDRQTRHIVPWTLYSIATAAACRNISKKFQKLRFFIPALLFAYFGILYKMVSW